MAQAARCAGPAWTNHSANLSGICKGPVVLAGAGQYSARLLTLRTLRSAGYIDYPYLEDTDWGKQHAS